MAILVIVCLGLAFVAGVTESARIIKELHIVSGELHARMAILESMSNGMGDGIRARFDALEDQIKGKL